VSFGTYRAVHSAMSRHLEKVRQLYQSDLAKRFGRYVYPRRSR
jgi:hypothetical protein